MEGRKAKEDARNVRETMAEDGKGGLHVWLARTEFCGETFMWIGHNRGEE